MGSTNNIFNQGGLMVFGKEIIIETKGFSDIVNITNEVDSIAAESGVKNGLVNIFIVGSTATVSTMEYEPSLVEDTRDQLEEFVASDKLTRHSKTWGDDNGFSHIRATFMGPGITVPLNNGKMVLGKWQQIVVIDHDNRPRSRKVFVQIWENNRHFI
jgi:secondary thiamine-phosphate synthase enzyme